MKDNIRYVVRTIENEKRLVTIEGTKEDYLLGKFDKYIKVAYRMRPDQIEIRLTN